MLLDTIDYLGQQILQPFSIEPPPFTLVWWLKGTRKSSTEAPISFFLSLAFESSGLKFLSWLWLVCGVGSLRCKMVWAGPAGVTHWVGYSWVTHETP